MSEAITPETQIKDKISQYQYDLAQAKKAIYAAWAADESRSMSTAKLCAANAAMGELPESGLCSGFVCAYALVEEMIAKGELSLE